MADKVGRPIKPVYGIKSDEQGYRAAINELSTLIALRQGWSHHAARRAAIKERIEELFDQLWPEEKA